MWVAADWAPLTQILRALFQGFSSFCASLFTMKVSIKVKHNYLHLLALCFLILPQLKCSYHSFLPHICIVLRSVLSLHASHTTAKMIPCLEPVFFIFRGWDINNLSHFHQGRPSQWWAAAGQREQSLLKNMVHIPTSGFNQSLIVEIWLLKNSSRLFSLEAHRTVIQAHVVHVHCSHTVSSVSNCLLVTWVECGWQLITLQQP